MSARGLVARLCLGIGLASVGGAQTSAVSEGRDPVVSVNAWPAVTQTARPWTRWWWPGSAVTRTGLTKQLEQFAAAGIGGVEITPIYGARGADSQYLEFLSPEWIGMLAHAAHEARRLGLGVDMATGTGWPFGGPRVAPADGSSALALVDGRLAGRPTGMQVKRAAPGGEGLVLDPYSLPALERYLAPFTQALAALARGALRSQFHDSFEYFNASWSPGLPAAFQELNGYDLQAYAAELAGTQPLDADILGRIKGDYRRTLGKLHLDYLQRWVYWSHANGFLARNQAHGAPTNLLDLYGASDIPETESFGATRLPIAGLRQDADDINEDPDPAINLIGRFASSAAHVAGRTLVSSETLTWLRENFRESPAAAKPQLDRLFIAGINHVFYHGATYSPADAAWPGWFFYAATQLNPSNPLWRDYAAMHAYVARVQSVLQQGNPDNGVLLYWPQADLDDDPQGLMRQYGMHENRWSKGSHTGRLALELLDAGYSFDFISDTQLRQVRVANQRLWTAAGTPYDLIVVPRTGRMPVETLAALATLTGQGARVVFEAWPEDVPGYGRLTERRAEFTRLLADSALRANGRLVPDLVQQLRVHGARREQLSSLGLWYVRRGREQGLSDYFVMNPTGQRIGAWVSLDSNQAPVAILDPLTGSSGMASERGDGGQRRIYLQIDSGQSLILRTWRQPPEIPGWRYWEAISAGEPIEGRWRLRFLEGGPTLPKPATLSALASWTTLPDPDARRFSGSARYRIEFDAPAVDAEAWRLELGDLRETARVTLNGRALGTVWSLPASLHVDGRLNKRGNVLEVEVTNLAANRVRDLDLRKVAWKVMKDINLASLHYRALDAAQWDPAPSGLLGPVRLVPLRLVSHRAPAPGAP